MREKIQRFMMGRYGSDQLNRFLLIVSMVALVLSFFTFRLFYWLGVIVLIYAYYRMMSRNYGKRSAENTKYLQMTYRLRGVVGRYKKMWSQRKTHRFFKCPSCKQQIRVPKGHGHIQITCPKCRMSFNKTT